MRSITRTFVAGLLVVLMVLLALGALPSLLRSGDPYYLQATPVNADGGPPESVDATTLSERRYPYTVGALDAAGPDGAGRSEPYWKGPFGLKGAFSHSPFDEVESYRAQYPDAVADGTAFVSYEGERYRLEVVQP